MKTFLYRLTTIRNAKEDGVIVFGSQRYYHNQLLMVVEANSAEHAAQALNTRIVGFFERSSVNRPTVYYTSVDTGHFFLSLKEVEKGDEITHPDFKEKMRLKITAP